MTDNTVFTSASQEALDATRGTAARYGMFFRPRIFADLIPVPDDEAGEAGVQDSPASSLSPAATSFTPTEIRYLRCQGCMRGVLQLHRVP